MLKHSGGRRTARVSHEVSGFHREVLILSEAHRIIRNQCRMEAPVPTLSAVMTELKKKGSEKTRKIYARHGMAPERVYGVSVADLKVIAKTIKGQQELACDLYETGNMDAMYLAGMVADGAKLTKQKLQTWSKSAVDLQMISEYTVPWLAVENAHARELALEWMDAKTAHVAASGWRTYAGLLATTPDESLDLKEIEDLLARVEKEIGSAPNRVKNTMNSFVISVGSYVKPLLKQAKATAGRIGAVKVDMGDTACKVPLASAYIEKVEKMGRVGKKRKTIRC
jgi:3-methyladenine DNA glycosylase AlkD